MFDEKIISAGAVLCLVVITGVILIFCGVLRVYDWCVDNSNSIKEEAMQEAIQLQMSGENVNHLPSSSFDFDRRPTIEI